LHAGVATVACRMLRDPVLTGESAVEHTVSDVARHLLGADQHAFDLRIVDRREIRPGARVDVEPGPREQLDRRVLQGALWKSKLDLHFTLLKHVR
jgi:hypothetical protein